MLLRPHASAVPIASTRSLERKHLIHQSHACASRSHASAPAIARTRSSDHLRAMGGAYSCDPWIRFVRLVEHIRTIERAYSYDRASIFVRSMDQIRTVGGAYAYDWASIFVRSMDQIRTVSGAYAYDRGSIFVRSGERARAVGCGPVGVPGRIRTCDPQLRRLLLYPTELRGRRATRAAAKWSGREDSNLRPPAPKAGALPDCATPRLRAAAEFPTGAFHRPFRWRAPV